MKYLKLFEEHSDDWDEDKLLFFIETFDANNIEMVHTMLGEKEFHKLINKHYDFDWFVENNAIGSGDVLESFIELVNMDELWIAHKNIKTLPKNIYKLKNINQIDIRKCGLTSLPKELFEMVNLDYLDLSENEITEIPKDINKLVNLGGLNLGNNKIKKLPKELYELKKILSLVLEGNQIEEVSEDILNMNLDYLFIYNNPLNDDTLGLFHEIYDQFQDLLY